MIPLLEKQTDTIVIRESTQGDAARLADYFAVLASELVNNTGFRSVLIDVSYNGALDYITRHAKSETSNLFLAIEGEAIVGLIAATGDRMPFRRHNAEVSINVHPDYRGRGLGSRLFEWLLPWVANESRIRRLYLEVLTRNTSAIGLYTKFGFTVEARFENIYYLLDENPPSYQSSLVMARYYA